MITKENGVKIGDKHSYYDFHLILTEKSISTPKPQKKYVSIPGRDGSIDLTESITGDVNYDDRTIKLTFYVMAKAENWSAAISELQNYAAGKRMDFVFDDDVAFYRSGRIESIEPKQSGKKMNLVMQITAEPYKHDIQSSSEEWEWDTFDFETGYVPEPTITVAGSATAKVYGRRMKTYPTITTDAAMQIQYNGETVAVTKGTTKLYNFILEDGVNEITIIGNGTAIIDYRGGSL